jgi:two-component system, OmpR family, sensor histidine kinase KdpD
MATISIRKLSKIQQYLYSLVLILAVSSICYAFSEYTGYHTAALLLLVTVSIIAMFCDIMPVIVAAVSSALIWNYYFIPPLYTFHIGKSEDILMFLMYFIIALLNAVLTIKIRQIEKKIQLQEEQENFIRSYNTLLDTLSIELQTPLSALKSATIELWKHGEEFLDNRVEQVSKILFATRQLDRRIENMLTLSRLESGTQVINMDWYDINQLIHQLVKETGEIGIRNRFNVQVPDMLPAFYIDGNLIKKALNNLINNAITYSPEGSVITISALYIIDQLVITVEDEGSGFSEEQLEKALGKFSPLESSKSGGLSLGLYITKGIVDAHDGSILLKNNDGKGARITVSLPVKTTYIRNNRIE